MTQNQLAYLSGLLDADGFIGLDDGLLYELKPCVRSGVTTRKVCRWLQVHFGGEFYRVPRADGTKVYYWKLTGLPADALAGELKNQPTRYMNIGAYYAGRVDAKGFNDPEINGIEPERLLRSISPYLVERKDQAKAILKVIQH
jgi:hypothetical protein